MEFVNQYMYYHKAFLALLDYLSRAHEIEIRPSSVSGIDYLWRYRMDFFQILVVASPGPYGEIFLCVCDFFFFFWGGDPMEAKVSKGCSSYKWQPKLLKLVPNFPPMVLTKLRWEFF